MDILKNLLAKPNDSFDNVSDFKVRENTESTETSEPVKKKTKINNQRKQIEDIENFLEKIEWKQY